MRKVKNSPSSYLKRSQIRPACVAIKRVPDVPRKRTQVDFNDAVIDSNFYVSFRMASKNEKKK